MEWADARNVAEKSPVFKAIVFKTFILPYRPNNFSGVINILNLKEKITALILKFCCVFLKALIFLNKYSFQESKGKYLTNNVTEKTMKLFHRSCVLCFFMLRNGKIETNLL